jgi:hypothetical protein
VQLLRRTYVGVETQYCGGTFEPPCGGSIATPGTIGFGTSAGPEEPTYRVTFVPLPLDINADDVVNAADVAAVLAAWGDLKQDNFADTNLDGRVDAVDLVRVLSGWGGDGRE